MTDTICAIATPPGSGGVGIVRLSGPGVPALARALTGRLPAPRHAVLGTVRNGDGEILDRGLVVFFPGPASYTGEDVLELHLHGAPVVLAGVVRAAVAAGARHARPGEFSQRAFVNGKLDLAQAEAVADLIAATSEQAARAAARSLEGRFSERVEALVEQLTALRVHVEAALDFPDDDIDFLADGAVAARLETCLEQARALHARAFAGRVLNDGLKIAIVGRPNAGKSSLFNALLQRDAAIVTDVPGTTRDVVRETAQLAGVAVTLADTAGLRETEDAVEREGVRRAQAELESADLVLWVVDVTDSDVPRPPATGAALIRINNKIDCLADPVRRPDDGVCISARTGQGLDALDAEVARHFGLSDAAAGEFSARQRHVDCIAAATEHLEHGRAALAETGSGELLAEDLRLAADALGEITGRIHSDDLLGRIFASFCIGK